MRNTAIVKIVLSSVCALALIAAMVLGIVFRKDSNGNLNFKISIGPAGFYNDTGYSVGNFEADDVPAKFDIDWVAGNITFKISEDGKFRLTESSGLPDNYTMRVKYENGTVYVKPYKSGFVFTSVQTKDLTVEIPSACLGSVISIDTGAGNLSFTGITASLVDVDMGAGSMTVISSVIDSFDLDMGAGNLTLLGDFGEVNADIGAGDVTVEGTLSSLELDAGVGNTDINVTNSPREINVDTAGGDVRVTLPADCPGFEAELDSVLGDIEVIGFDGTVRSKHEITYGNGRTEIDVDVAAGSLTIRKAE